MSKGTMAGANTSLFTNRDILKLIVPLFFEQLLFMSVGMADTLMVGSLGSASISAVALTDQFSNFIAGIFFALATGGAVVVSQFIGGKNLVRAKESAGQLLLVVLVAGIGVALLSEIFLKQIISLLFGKLDADVYSALILYFRIIITGFPFIAVYGGCAALFRSMNKTKVTMYISLASNLINIAGNALLIFGLGWGVAGAAYATVLSRIFSMVVILILIADRSRLVHISFRMKSRFSWSLVRKILYIGIPGGIENGVFQFGRLVVLGLIASYGTREIAANAIANTVDHLGCVAASVFSLAIVTVVGQAVGTGSVETVRYYTRKIMLLASSSHFVWNILIFCLTPLILGCFSRIDPDTRHLAWILILIHNGLGMLIWPFSFVFPNALRSMNDVRPPMIISVGSMVIVRVGLSYLFAPVFHSGVYAVWTAMIFDWIVRSTGFYLRYRSNAWIPLSRCHSTAPQPVQVKNG